MRGRLSRICPFLFSHRQEVEPINQSPDLLTYLLTHIGLYVAFTL
jgi:hypothetical protein